MADWASRIMCAVRPAGDGMGGRRALAAPRRQRVAVACGHQRQAPGVGTPISGCGAGGGVGSQGGKGFLKHGASTSERVMAAWRHYTTSAARPVEEMVWCGHVD